MPNLNEIINGVIDEEKKHWEKHSAGTYKDGAIEALNMFQSRTPKLVERIEKEIMLQIEEDLNNGKFHSICSNETTFKNYIINTLKGGKDK